MQQYPNPLCWSSGLLGQLIPSVAYWSPPPGGRQGSRPGLWEHVCPGGLPGSTGARCQPCPGCGHARAHARSERASRASAHASTLALAVSTRGVRVHTHDRARGSATSPTCRGCLESQDRPPSARARPRRPGSQEAFCSRKVCGHVAPACCQASARWGRTCSSAPTPRGEWEGALVATLAPPLPPAV